MFEFANYTVDSIHNTDALSLSALMVSNADRFQRYFPGTLAQNLTLETSTEFIAKKTIEFDSKNEFLFTINQETKVIGLVYIKELDWNKKQGEFAYCIGEGHGGKGVITHAVKYLSEYAFNSLGLEVLQIIVHKDNMPSVNVAKKGDFTWQRTLPNEYTPPNEAPLDMELYELYKN